MFVKISTVPAGAVVTLAAGVVVADTEAGLPPSSTFPTAEQKFSNITKSEYSDAGKAVAAY